MLHAALAECYPQLNLAVPSTSGACFVFFVVLKCTAGQGVAWDGDDFE